MQEHNKNQEAVIAIAGKHLGQVGGAGYSDQYNPDLLVAIPRNLNREAYGIDEANLPFVGSDVWNAYEVSAITETGRPVVGMLKIVYPSDSPLHVESKSIKLYLNSFNMTRLGKTAKECIAEIEGRVCRDLTELLETEVTATLYTESPEKEYSFTGYPRIQDMIDLDKVEFNTYKSDEKQLESSNHFGEFRVDIDFLRSNCRVTSQPDFGNMFVYMKGDNLPTIESLAKYIVSHRQVSHFHEEICEMSFTHLMDAFKPEELMIACLYSRRGGIDINPVRATHSHLIPDWMKDGDKKMKKTLKQ